MGILEAGFASHIERAELGITCDRERLIHGHFALELRSIVHLQRACVHSASLQACAFQLAFRSHITKVIDSHMAFDRSFFCGVNAVDSGGALLDGSDIFLIVLNVICIRLDIARELVIFILAFRLFSIDLPFQLSVFRLEVTNGCCIVANLTFCGSNCIIDISLIRFLCQFT